MNIFVARQPILDRDQKIAGFELLFRQGFTNMFDGTNGDEATSSVIVNSFFSIGINRLTAGKKAFINLTANLLKRDMITILPKDDVVLEILEDVNPSDPQVMLACKKLRDLGYVLALDDFVFRPEYRPLLELANIVKIDFRTTRIAGIRNVIKDTSFSHIKFLAEKVETPEEFELAKSLGYSLFQGYYFSKPIITSEKDIPESKVKCLQLLTLINNPESDYDRLESIIKSDVSLTYKLLKLINSSAFGIRSEIYSVRQAITLLGLREIKKWLSLILLRKIGKDSPDELIRTSLVRAIFGELLANKVGLSLEGNNAFLMGIFSLLAVYLNRPLSEVLSELPISEQVKQALEGVQNPYRDIFEIVLSYEKADWSSFSHFVKKTSLDEKEVAELYVQALQTADQFI